MAENLQEYYKRMAEAIDTQLEQKGKAALFYPVGSGSGRIVWAWAATACLCLLKPSFRT